MAKRSHLYSFHREHGKLTEFGGFEMPVWYAGIVDEHNAVRNAAGIFDVSHMGRFSIRGKDATLLLDRALPSDVPKVRPGRAFYSTICNESGGIVDDTVTNKVSETEYLTVVNASNRGKDYRHLAGLSSGLSVELSDVSDETALLAFQGPLALPIAQKIADVDLSAVRRFGFTECTLAGSKCVASRTGYTGEDGFEFLVLDCPLDEPTPALRIWEALLDLGKDKGVLPCGLGARDSLRLEAGMCLYGNDIDEGTTPVEAALESIVAKDKKEGYVGRETIERELREGVRRRRVAFSMLHGGIPRHGYSIKFSGSKVGSVTSGTFSPTVKNGIGMGYVPPELSRKGECFWVEIRNAEHQAAVVSVPFYDTTRFGYKRTQ